MSIVFFVFFIISLFKKEAFYDNEFIMWALFCIADYLLLGLILWR